MRPLAARAYGKPVLVIGTIGFLFLLLVALLWTLNTRPAAAHTCTGAFHEHDSHKPKHTCHKHCKNAGQDHGEDCTVNNPTPVPKDRDDDDDDNNDGGGGGPGNPAPTSTPTNTPGPTPTPTNTPTPTPTPTPTVTPTPTATPTPKPVPSKVDCVIDANGNAWLPLEIVSSYAVLYWAEYTHYWKWVSPQPSSGDVVLVGQSVDGWSKNVQAWCPDSASRAGDGTDCLKTGGPKRVWPRYACASNSAYTGSWHPEDTGSTDFKVTWWSYDEYCLVEKSDHFRFVSGSGACRSLAPTPTPTSVPQPTPSPLAVTFGGEIFTVDSHLLISQVLDRSNANVTLDIEVEIVPGSVGVANTNVPAGLTTVWPPVTGVELWAELAAEIACADVAGIPGGCATLPRKGHRLSLHTLSQADVLKQLSASAWDPCAQPAFKGAPADAILIDEDVADRLLAVNATGTGGGPGGWIVGVSVTTGTVAAGSCTPPTAAAQASAAASDTAPDRAVVALRLADQVAK